jgi:undecaprenyl diphosphate synthase
LSGHQAGVRNMLRMVKYLSDHPIQYVTLYAFSTENWGRPEEEVRGLFALLARFIDRYLAYLHEQNIRLIHLGRLDQVPDRIKDSIGRAVDLTRNNSRMTLNIAFNYGGRAEIVDAVRRIVADGLRPEEIDEPRFEKYLYTAGAPPVDLLIRTGGEVRLSNFLIWQTAYSEYYLTDVLWPDFGRKDIEKALLSYSQRKRRFGAL